MALNYRFIGDTPNDFQVFTDGIRAMNPSGTIVTPDSFHITEVRGLSEIDGANGMGNVIVEETTRVEIMGLATDNGYELIEFDDADELSTLYDPPRITAFSPANGGTAAALTSNIVLTFSENIAKAAATGPVIKLINLTTNAVVETFAFDSAIVTVSTTQATINPTSNLTASNSYTILIDNGYFTNTGATENHGGIHSLAYYTFDAPAS